MGVEQSIAEGGWPCNGQWECRDECVICETERLVQVLRCCSW
jgi:hypothetical protein